MTNSIVDVKESDVIMVIGSNTTEQHPLIGSRILSAARRGAKLIVADNRRIRHFLKKLGAVDEGYRKAGAWRDGKPLDVREVAFFRPWEAEVQ